MIRRSIPVWFFWLLMIGGVVGVVGGYVYLSEVQTAKNASQTIVPGLKGFAEGFKRITATTGLASNPKPAMLWTDLRATYWRLFLGLSLGVIASILIGIGMGSYRWIEALLSPIISFLSKIPPTAMMPIYFILVGTDQKMFTAMVALGVFFTMAQAIYQPYKKTSRTMRSTKLTRSVRPTLRFSTR